MATKREERKGIRQFRAKRDDGSLILLTTRLPMQAETHAARLEYSAVFNDSLKHGLPTRTKMLKDLERSGLWGQAEKEEFERIRTEALGVDKQLTGLRKSLAEKQGNTNFLGTPEERTIQGEISTLQARFDQLNAEFISMRQEVESMLEHTADARADDAFRNCLVACVTEYDDGVSKGKRVWESIDSYVDENDMMLSQRALYEYLYCTAGQPSAWKDKDEPKALDKGTEKETTQLDGHNA